MDNTSQPSFSESAVPSSQLPLSEGAPASSPPLSIEARDAIQMWVQQNSFEQEVHATSSTILVDPKRAELHGLPNPARAGFAQPHEFGPLSDGQGSGSLISPAPKPDSADLPPRALSPNSACATKEACQTEARGHQTTDSSSPSHQDNFGDTPTPLLKNFRESPAIKRDPSSLFPKILLQESNNNPNSSSIPRNLGEETFTSFKYRESCNDAEDGPMSFKPSVKLQMETIFGSMLSSDAGFRLPSSKRFRMAEYGACTSRSADLAQTFISQLSNRICPPGEDDQADSGLPEKIFFTVIHCDKPRANFSSLQKSAAAAYLSTSWQTNHVPKLLRRVYASYTTANFGGTMTAPRSISVGFSLMDLHQIKTKPVAGTIHNQSELTAFLRARAIEFQKNGILILAFVVGTPPEKAHNQIRPISSRIFSGDHKADQPEISKEKLRHQDFAAASSETNRSPLRQSNHSGRENEPRPEDEDHMEPQTPHVWLTINRLLTRTLQSLVSRGLLLPSIALKMEQVPMHIRTAEDVRSALMCVKNEWKLKWSFGLGTEPYLNSLLSSSETGGEHQTPRHLSPPISPPPSPPEDLDSSNSSNSSAENSVSTETQYESSTIKAEPILTVQHPAQQDFHEGMIGLEKWIEHVVNFSRISYEGHFRSVLQKFKEESGKKDFGFVDNVMEILWLDLEHRLESDSQALESVRSLVLDIAIIGLRRS